ncbi:hypothetical protein [Arcticibacterium luteifluviistationis]|uniref:Lipoprotein n=1 Tax=Arcticibacterium luteifluviistationis TaxID=1784714 RepID=A0A2Z4GF57_9BACT|nr:hypothetical protein [Arcticibacterium luteifluviistationis]AWV99423.1 hypothetical protein DJ013_15140 [Arcticibacterium luteifluviistationis]
MSRHFFLVCLSFITFSCFTKQEKKVISKAVYHWKSTYQPSQKAKETVKALNIKKTYIRFFDIDFNAKANEAIPKGMVKFKDSPEGDIVPVIYITNRTFKSINETEITNLAVKTAAKIKSITSADSLVFNEVQLDCDWTETTKAKYFHFLEKLKSEFGGNVKLTCTLRLHQVKFKEKTGVPPVDRVALMLYNVGDWTNVQTKNSLFDPDIIDQYIYRLPEYPLPVDIALPIYQQAIVFRNNRFHTYFKNVSKIDLQKHFNTKPGENGKLLICQENCEFQNQSFRIGDVFRHEKVDFKTLNKVKKAILKKIKNKDVQVLLFHLDDKSLDNFTLKQYSTLLEN